MGALDYIEDLDRSVFDSANQQDYAKRAQKGLSEALIRKISTTKGEPDWMLQLRLGALKKFNAMELPTWGVDLSVLNFDDIIY